MKAQMSMEMLLYVSLAGISLLLAGRQLGLVLEKAGQQSSYYEVAQFEMRINSALINGTGMLSLFVPAGFCNASGVGNGSGLRVFNSSVSFVAPIYFGNSLCPDDAYATLEFEKNGSIIYVRRIE
ncbi:MAG: hypothetical protein ACP5TJ_00890 [Candidatus Micrarchaeia archaeon]